MWLISSASSILLMSLSFKPCFLQVPCLLSQRSTKCFRTESWDGITTVHLSAQGCGKGHRERQFPVEKRATGNEAILDWSSQSPALAPAVAKLKKEDEQKHQ